MNQQDYDHFAQVLKSRSGIELGPEKGYLLESRLRAVAGTSGHADVAALLRAVRLAPSEPVVAAAVDAMTTNETFFFRDATPFEQLKGLLPSLVKARGGQPVRIWCAACSTGQEPYSIAMMVEEEAPKIPGLKVDILATDLSERCLQKARAGLYSQFESQRGLTVQRLVRHFEAAPDGFRVKPALRGAIRWRSLNLLADFRFIGQFDVVFCRNVLIYFDRPTKAQILERIAERLADGGRMLLGASETVLGITTAFESAPGAHGLYSKSAKPVPAAPRTAMPAAR
jgi:chemotaxis protein methyltransferase CheR